MKKNFEIKVEKRVLKKDLPKIPLNARRLIYIKIERLSEDPYPIGVKKLENYRPDTFRVRQGNYRILFRVEESQEIVRIIAIGIRGSVYK